MATKTWTQTSGNLASTDANWSGAAKPEAGDDVIFDGTSTAACTWDLAIILGTLSINTGYSGVITVAASTSWGTIGNVSMVAGTFTSVITSPFDCGGNFVTAATMTAFTTDVFDLEMSGTGKSLSLVKSTSVYRLTVSGTITVTSGGATGAYYSLVIEEGATLTVNATFTVRNYGGAGNDCFLNSGSVDGTAILYFIFSVDYTHAFGTISAPVTISLRSSASASRTCTLAGDTEFGGGLTIVSSHATYTITVSHGTNYSLDVGGVLTLGVRGIMTQGTGAWVFQEYLQSGASSVFAQGAVVGVFGDITISDGTFTGDMVNNIYYGGEYTIGGTITGLFVERTTGFTLTERWPDVIVGYAEGVYYALNCATGALISYGSYGKVYADAIAALPSGSGVIVDKTGESGAAPSINRYASGVAYVSENYGDSTGTGAQQTIAHGLSATPTRILLSEYNTGLAIPYQSAAADATNIYVTAVSAKTWQWEAKVV